MNRKMIYTLLIILAVLIGWQGYEFWVAVGRQPRGERLERCKQSPQWKDGEFVNVHETPTLTGDEGFFGQMRKFLFGKVNDLKPSRDIPVVKTALKDIPREEEICVWLGHSTVYIQTGGARFLFDPVLTNKLPVWWFMRPFKGTDAYTVDDIPEVDYLVITHDHWDHLDWKMVRALKDRVGQVVCALGIGEHFEYWGYDPKKIHDLDWGERFGPLHCLPTRHFSGRLGQHKTLWASYLIDGSRRIFVSGDGGYDERFKQIGEKYPDIDLAVMENGQYDEGWRHIHTLPCELPTAISDLGARRVLTYHNSKYALANHSWTAPLDSIYEHAKGQPWHLLTPRIGEPILLDEQQKFEKWW
ncbi:MAG: MBL fold metallo-hydrolase [Bacteroidaceae bacterium]|nr:MBL fold metallo-hydrolase [Bacteroidaceae bacterium]